MITTVFKNSSPINYTFVGVLMFLFFFISQFSLDFSIFSINQIFLKVIILVLLIATLVLCNFVTKKNDLSKDNSYTILFCFLFLAFFPNLFENFNLIFANFLILLAMRRLISLQSLKFSKEKIFDASLLIFIASLFYFWSILFVILIFASIILNVSKDYRNWVLPFLAFFAIAISFMLFSFIVDHSIIDGFLAKVNYSFEMNYFKSIYQNISFSLYVTSTIFFLTTFFLTFSTKPLIKNSSYKKLIIWYLIGIIIYAIAPNKSNEVLIFTFAPIAIIATMFVESVQVKWQQELTLALIVVCSFFSFFSQL